MRKRPIQRLRVRRAEYIIPAFSFPNTWAGVSELLCQYAISNTQYFSFKLPITENDTFILAVRWSESPYVYRYKFYENKGEVLYFPVYNGQRIGVNAYLEVWNVANQSVASLTSDLYLETSLLIEPSLCSPCQENVSQTTLVQYVPDTLPPYTYCNPFCSPLC